MRGYLRMVVDALSELTPRQLHRPQEALVKVLIILWLIPRFSSGCI